jgi:hypothetical protein
MISIKAPDRPKALTDASTLYQTLRWMGVPVSSGRDPHTGKTAVEIIGTRIRFHFDANGRLSAIED